MEIILDRINHGHRLIRCFPGEVVGVHLTEDGVRVLGEHWAGWS
jgi:hypothetical protein